MNESILNIVIKIKKILLSGNLLCFEYLLMLSNMLRIVFIKPSMISIIGIPGFNSQLFK